MRAQVLVDLEFVADELEATLLDVVNDAHVLAHALLESLAPQFELDVPVLVLLGGTSGVLGHLEVTEVGVEIRLEVSDAEHEESRLPLVLRDIGEDNLALESSLVAIVVELRGLYLVLDASRALSIEDFSY